jgi:hypothetical protein
MNQKLLLLNNNITGSMSTTINFYSKNKTQRDPYMVDITLEEIESIMTVNNLEKRIERNVSRHSLSSNKPQRESRSCIT